MRASPGLRLSASFIEQPAALLLMAGVLMMRGGGGGSTGGMVKAKKKGEAGPSVNYVTRNKAIRTLQISLKDFRYVRSADSTDCVAVFHCCPDALYWLLSLSVLQSIVYSERYLPARSAKEKARKRQNLLSH